MNNERQKLLRNSLSYVTATAMAQMVGVVRSVILPLIFAPVQLGIWNLMNVVMSYGSNTHLGICHAMNKTIPALRGQGRVEEVDITKDNVFWVNLALGAVAGVALWCTAEFVRPEYKGPLRVTSITVFVLTIFSYLHCLLRADSRFDLISRGVAALGILSTVLVVFFAFCFGDRLKGALIGIAMAYIVVVAYWFVKGNYRFSFSLQAKVIQKLFLAGIPLITITALDVIFLSIDRWILASRLGDTALGYYALGIMASNMIALVPGSIASVLYPKMLETFGACGNSLALRGLFVGPVRAVAALMSILIGFSVLLLPFLIRSFLPKYVPSITLMSILLVAAFFYSSSFISGSLLVSINKQKIVIQVQAVAIATAIALDLVVLWMGWGAVGVAISTSTAYFIFGCGYMLFAAHRVFERPIDIIRFFIEVLGISSVMILALVLSIFIIPEGATFRAASVFVVMRIALFSALLFPVLWWFNRGGELVSIVREILSNRFSAKQA